MSENNRMDQDSKKREREREENVNSKKPKVLPEPAPTPGGGAGNAPTRVSQLPVPAPTPGGGAGGANGGGGALAPGVSVAELNAAKRRAQDADRKLKQTTFKERQNTSQQKIALAEARGKGKRTDIFNQYQKEEELRKQQSAHAEEAHYERAAALAKANENRKELAEERKKAQQISHENKKYLLQIRKELEAVRQENAQKKIEKMVEKERQKDKTRQELEKAKAVRIQERKAAATEKEVILKSKADADKKAVLDLSLDDIIPAIDTKYAEIRELLAENINLTLASENDTGDNYKGNSVIDEVLFAQVNDKPLQPMGINNLLKTFYENEDIGKENVLKELTKHLVKFTKISGTVVKLDALEDIFRDQQFLTEKLTGKTPLEKTVQDYQNTSSQDFFPMCKALETDLVGFANNVEEATTDLLNSIEFAVETKVGKNYDEAAKQITQLPGWGEKDYNQLTENLNALYSRKAVDITTPHSFEKIWLLNGEINKRIDQYNALLKSYNEKLSKAEEKKKLMPMLVKAFGVLVDLNVENISDEFTKDLNKTFDETQRKLYSLDTDAINGVFTEDNLQKVDDINPLTFAQDPKSISGTIEILKKLKSKAEGTLKKAWGQTNYLDLVLVPDDLMNTDYAENPYISDFDDIRAKIREINNKYLTLSEFDVTAFWKSCMQMEFDKKFEDIMKEDVKVDLEKIMELKKKYKNIKTKADSKISEAVAMNNKVTKRKRQLESLNASNNSDVKRHLGLCDDKQLEIADKIDIQNGGSSGELKKQITFEDLEKLSVDNNPNFIRDFATIKKNIQYVKEQRAAAKTKATSENGGAESTDFSTQLKLLPLSLFSGFRPTFYAAPLRFGDERTRSSQLVLKKLFFPTTTALKVFAPVLSFAETIAEQKPLVLKKLFFPTTTALKVFAPVLSFAETIAEQKPLVLKKLFFPTTTALKVFAPVLSFTETIAEQKPLVLKKLFFPTTTALKVFAPVLSFAKTIAESRPLVLKKLFFPTTTALKVFAPKLSFVKARRKLALKKLFFPTSVSLKVFAPRLTKGHLEDIIKTNKRIDEKWRDSIFTDAMINRDSSDRMRSLRVQTVDEPGDDLMNLKMNYNGKREEFEFFNVFDNPKIYKVNVGLPDIAPPRRILRSLPVLNVGA